MSHSVFSIIALFGACVVYPFAIIWLRETRPGWMQGGVVGCLSLGHCWCHGAFPLERFSSWEELQGGMGLGGYEVNVGFWCFAVRDSKGGLTTV